MNHYFSKTVCLVLVAMAFSLPQAKAALIVRTADPAFITAGDTFKFDIDADGTLDYKITVLDHDPYSMVINGLFGNEIETDGNNRALALIKGEVVGTFNSWQSGATIYKYQVPNHHFESGVMRYVGLRFDANHYGYLEVKVVDPSTLMLYSYGYQTVGAYNIEAGENSTTGIERPLPADYKVVMNNGQLTIHAPDAALIGKIELMDLSGRTLRENAGHNLPVDTRGLPAQAYLLAVYHDKAMRPMVRKLVLTE